MSERPESHAKLARYAWIVIVATLFVVLWGALVRATGSGAGCGSHWPLCNGEVVPQAETVATTIEFTHRVTSGFSVLMVVWLTIWTYRVFRKGHPARPAAMWSLIFMLGEAAIGAALVLLSLVADNTSIARAWWMGVHLVNTFLLFGALTLTAYWAGGGRRIYIRGQGMFAWLLVAAFALTLFTGMSGAIAALGDTLFPASSLQEGLRQDFSPDAHPLTRLRVFHPFIAVVTAAFLLHAAGRMRLRPGAKRWATALHLTVLAQITLGVINLMLLAPVWMQLIHLFVADMLWIFLVLASAASLATVPDSTPADSPELARAA
ncbi:MAG: COX15/CtaA family protein [Acidobacteriota bacterium]